MDHKTLVATLSPEARAQLLQKSDAAGLRHLALHAGLIILCGSLIAIGVPGWPFLLVPQGILIIFLFTLQHECVHKTPFATERLNEWVMHICSLLIILPPTHFRYFHLAHHRHTNDPEHDPELQGVQPDTWPRFLATITGLPVWRFHIALTINNALGRCADTFVPAARQADIRREAQVMVAVYGCAALAITLGQTWIFWCWVVPAIVGQPFLRLYLMAEHGRCPAVANMLENSRTTYTNRIVRFLAWNMPYHAEHHAYPTVPFHNLPAFNQVAAAHIVNTSDGYVDYHRMAAKTRS